MASAKINQKEYLKKYLSNDVASSEKKKKKKKGKSAGNAVTKANVRIIDDDYDISQMQQISDKDLEVYAIGEDAPQIVGVVDDRPAELIAKEDYKQNEKWKVLAAIDGSLTINNFDDAGKMKSSNSHGPKEPAKRFTKYASDDDLSPVRLNERALSVSSDNSPVRRDTSTRSKPSRFADKSPERRQRKSRSPEQGRRRDEDQSTNRRKASNRDYSPKRKRGGSSSESSEEIHKKRDKRSSPSRKTSRSPAKRGEDNSYRSKGSRSPMRKVEDSSRRRGRNETSPRRRQRSNESPRREDSPQRRRRQDSDASPARKRRDSDDSPQRRRNASPSRKRKESPLRKPRTSPPKRNNVRKDSDASPPRKRKESSPPRRRKNLEPSPPRGRTDKEASAPRRRKDSDASPPRRRRDSDASPPRRRRDSDASPPRRPQIKQECSPDASPVRRRNVSPPRQIKSENPILNSKKLSRWSRDRSQCPAPGPSKMTKTLDGKSAGLQDANSVRQENHKFRQQEEEFFNRMSKDGSRHGEAVTRDRKTGRIRDVDAEMEVELEKMRKEQEKKAVYDRWGKGVKQVEEHKVRQEEALHEYNKPVARYADDADLDALLKTKERDGDPMLEYLRSKESARDTGKPAKPIYRGAYSENRFGIRPGYRWDGVDRSNGFEKRWFDVQNKKKAGEEEEYKYMTEDM